jgi:hypothetical protein
MTSDLRCLLSPWPFLLLFTAALPSMAVAQTTRYVDAQLSSACTTYTPAARSCGSGSSTAYKDLQSASAAAQPGDTVFVRQGTFTTQFVPQTSGTSAANITFQVYSNETATLTNINDAAIYLLNRNYLVIDGFTVTNVLGWGRIENSSHNIIRNNQFLVATAGGTTGGLKFIQSHYNKVLNNTFTDGNDDMLLQQSDRNLILGNSFFKGRHTLLNISCGNYNVVRGNTFDNPTQKAIESFDCEGTVSGQPVLLDATKHNVWEGNTFAGTASSTRDYDFNAMQYSGQNGIVRRNVYHDNLGGGVNFQLYADEALYNYSHRLYNNTFYNNKCEAIAASGNTSPSQYFDNIVKNNLLYKNVNCSGAANQTSIGNSTAVVLTSNAIVTSSPLFVSETTHDFHLQSGSPQIDAGAFLTTTAVAGSGTSMRLADVGYFYDGYGIVGEVGDTIQLAGQGARATIVAIDYTNKVLTLSQSLTWTAGQGVALAYVGSAPDMGAFESGAVISTAPAAPTNLRIVP